MMHCGNGSELAKGDQKSARPDLAGLVTAFLGNQ
jgi:hypothetical protein